MVNLLFISGDSKINAIKNSLQPLLKVKIDVVSDFDYGLKDVFEKRPDIVFIQEQIAGVTGESVARHIQMLLGSGAPSFIFMHDGNLKAKSIKGLYDHLIDLSHDDTKVVEDIQYTLKSLLGSQWQKIYVSPKAKKPVITPAVAVPGDHRVIADQLVGDLLSSQDGVTPDQGQNKHLLDAAEPEPSTEEPFRFVSSTDDQLEEILSAVASEIKDKDKVAATVSAAGIDKLSVTSEPALSSTPLAPAATPRIAPEPFLQDVVAPPPDKPVTAQVVSPEKEPSAAASLPADMTEKPQSPPISPADFMIGREDSSLEMVANKIILDPKQANHSNPAVWKRFTVIVSLAILCAVGYYWYMVKHKLHLPAFMVKTYNPAVVAPPAEKPVAMINVTQKSLSTTHKDIKNTVPSFIPLAGHDRSFASQKPGWERYVGINSEFRVFRSGGKLKAVQVLATKGHVISESSLKKILIELTGSGEYRVTSQEQKLGFQVSHAAVARKADLLIYRKKTAVHAFVVSLD